ncbi:MAG: hypothetical protein H6733_12715 [Alphaproteobacteria bacterium]|nr:hypothetical protein [Alphaproteobacteria bacterium]
MDLDPLTVALGALVGAVVGYLELLGLKHSVTALTDGRAAAAAIGSAVRLALVLVALLAVVQWWELSGLLGSLLGFVGVRSLAARKLSDDLQTPS